MVKDFDSTFCFHLLRDFSCLHFLGSIGAQNYFVVVDMYLPETTLFFL